MKNIKWSIEELKELERIVQSGWDWEFPGWKWVANVLNDKFNNNRTLNSVIAICRKHKF